MWFYSVIRMFSVYLRRINVTLTKSNNIYNCTLRYEIKTKTLSIIIKYKSFIRTIYLLIFYHTSNGAVFVDANIDNTAPSYY
jgi:ABC-type uncharacterized transport system permease subunit